MSQLTLRMSADNPDVWILPPEPWGYTPPEDRGVKRLRFWYYPYSIEDRMDILRHNGCPRIPQEAWEALFNGVWFGRPRMIGREQQKVYGIKVTEYKEEGTSSTLQYIKVNALYEIELFDENCGRIYTKEDCLFSRESRVVSGYHVGCAVHVILNGRTVKSLVERGKTAPLIKSANKL